MVLYSFVVVVVYTAAAAAAAAFRWLFDCPFFIFFFFSLRKEGTGNPDGGGVVSLSFFFLFELLWVLVLNVIKNFKNKYEFTRFVRSIGQVLRIALQDPALYLDLYREASLCSIV